MISFGIEQKVYVKKKVDNCSWQCSTLKTQKEFFIVILKIKQMRYFVSVIRSVLYSITILCSGILQLYKSCAFAVEGSRLPPSCDRPRNQCKHTQTRIDTYHRIWSNSGVSGTKKTAKNAAKPILFPFQDCHCKPNNCPSLAQQKKKKLKKQLRSNQYSQTRNRAYVL